jgi:hypothetical protein
VAGRVLPIVADRGDGRLLQSQMLSYDWSSKIFGFFLNIDKKKHLYQFFYFVCFTGTVMLE